MQLNQIALYFKRFESFVNLIIPLDLGCASKHLMVLKSVTSGLVGRKGQLTWLGNKRATSEAKSDQRKDCIVKTSLLRFTRSLS